MTPSSSSSSEIEREEAELGRWPRRLLHVPTMTSCAWGPGNTYGGHREPAYNAITYTWGRWRLDDDEQPEVPGLAVAGAAWRIPRVRPDAAFTAAQLRAVVRRATGVYAQAENPVMPTGRTAGFAPVEFVWLDVACIEQGSAGSGSGSARSASEVGRQARIFHGARQVFAWLSTISSAQLAESIMPELEGFHQLMNGVRAGRSMEPAAETSAQLSRIRDAFRALLGDPWFSSLWTLQEAFLRPDAVLLGREGEPVVLADDTDLHHILYDVLGAGDECYPHGDDNKLHPVVAHALPELRRLVEDSGLRALASLNGMATYVAASRRAASRAEDRIYGIQQIFRLRVGASAAHPAGRGSRRRHHSSPYSPKELELELGAQLMKHHPVLSQLHVGTDPAAPVGSGWFVSAKSAVPSELLGNVCSDEPESENTETPLCSLSVAEVGGTHWGRFDGGQIAGFSALHDVFEALDAQQQAGTARCLMMLHLSKTAELASSPEYARHAQQPVPQGEWQRRMARWLARDFEGRGRLFVLLVGSRRNYFYNTMLGVLLLRIPGGTAAAGPDGGLPYYRRVGLCWWDPVDEIGELGNPDITARLAGLPEEDFWRVESGYFG